MPADLLKLIQINTLKVILKFASSERTNITKSGKMGNALLITCNLHSHRPLASYLAKTRISVMVCKLNLPNTFCVPLGTANTSVLSKSFVRQLAVSFLVLFHSNTTS